MRNRYVLRCDEWENHKNPVYIKSIDKEGDSFGFCVTENVEEAKRFSMKKAFEWSNEIYDSYCDDFEVFCVQP